MTSKRSRGAWMDRHSSQARASSAEAEQPSVASADAPWNAAFTSAENR